MRRRWRSGSPIVVRPFQYGWSHGDVLVVLRSSRIVLDVIPPHGFVHSDIAVFVHFLFVFDHNKLETTFLGLTRIKLEMREIL